MVKKLIREKNVAHIIIASLFSVSLIFGMSGVSLPLQQSQQEAYASSQVQTQTQAQPPPNKVPQSTQAPPSDQVTPPPRPICNPKSPTLQPGSAGAKVAELQRVLTLVGYGSLLGQDGTNGKFGISTQNAVKKFQQDNKLPVDGKVGPITWGALCSIIPNSFIIELKSASPGSFRELMGALTPLLAKAGGRVVAVYDPINAFNVVFERPLANPEQFIKLLRDHPAVKGVFHDAIMTLDQQPPPTGINRVDADLSDAKSGDGRDIVIADIAILDSGVFPHPDLNIFKCVSFLAYSKFPIPNDCNDVLGHGTHVAGIAAAKDNNIGVVGTAPGARIWALKVVHDNGNIDDSDVLEGLTYVAAHAKDIEVVNLSMSGYGINYLDAKMINYLVQRGVVVVVSAGNDNIDAKYNTPANIDWAITVSAITDSDGKCGGLGGAIPEGNGLSHQPATINNPDDFFLSFSNFGAVVDLAAPGSNILSTANTGGYDSMSGTSMAAPHVAGAAALIKSLNPRYTPAAVSDFLKRAGTEVPSARLLNANAGNPLIPCNGAGEGYFDDRYPGGVVRTDNIREPLLHMRWIIPYYLQP